MPLSQKIGSLYVVATPIGHLDDFTLRAKKILTNIDIILCEDTRKTVKLLNHIGIKKPLISFHQHNEKNKIDWVISNLSKGKSMALVSDAGTPIISDPGYLLISTLRKKNISIIPIPGANAAITALCASGLSADRFIFEGFLPRKSSHRISHLMKLHNEPRTLIFYEACHRILSTLNDLCQCFSKQRKAVIARELTKTFETFYHGSLEELIKQLTADAYQQKGEFVILVSGNKEPQTNNNIDTHHLLSTLLSEMSISKATSIAAKLTKQSKHTLYQNALKLKNET